MLHIGLWGTLPNFNRVCNTACRWDSVESNQVVIVVFILLPIGYSYYLDVLA
jgi:hypothetical protein